MENEKKDIKTESELYMTLATLMNHQRTDENEQEVLDIVHNSSFSIEEKIIKIKEIDTNSFLNSNLYLLKKGKLSREGDELANNVMYALNGDSTIHEDSPQLLMETRLSLIKRPPRQTLMRFALRELPRMKIFAAKTGILRCRYLPPSVHMASGVEQYFLRHIQPLAASLLEPLDFIAENGWLYLSKTHYNLIHEFHLLCKRIYQLNREKGRSGEKSLFGRLRRLEHQFFICHYMTGYPEAICTAVQEVLATSRLYEKQADELTKNARKILFLSDNGPSLYSILTGMYMVLTRRMLDIDDLINRKSGSIISKAVFNCSKQVRTAINCYIEEKTKSLDVLYKQHLTLIRFKSYLKFKRDGEPDFSLLEVLVDTYRGPDDFFKQLDPGNLLQSASIIGEYFDSLAHAVLSQPVPVSEEEEPIQLFTRDAFRQQLTELNHITDELIRLSDKSRHVVISREKMAGAAERISSSTNTSHSEMEVMEKIMKFSEILFTIGETLSRVLNKGRAESKHEALELRDLRKNNLFVPYADSIIELPGLLEGESVSGALEMLTNICYSGAWFFQNRKIALLFEKQKQMENEIHSMFRLLEQLTSPAQMEQIRAFFPLL